MVTPDDRLWKLHVRKATGERLTAEEQSELDAWYSEKDQAEAVALGVAGEMSEVNPPQQQVDAILERIVITSQAMQKLATENEEIRRENMALRRQLLQLGVLHPA